MHTVVGDDVSWQKGEPCTVRLTQKEAGSARTATLIRMYQMRGEVVRAGVGEIRIHVVCKGNLLRQQDSASHQTSMYTSGWNLSISYWYSRRTVTVSVMEYPCIPIQLSSP